jgi:hypothetical protein
VQDNIFDFRRRVEAVLIERAGRIGVYQAKRLNTLCILMALAARAALRLAAVERQPEVDHARWCGYADRVAKFSQQADQVFESLGLGGGGEDWLSQLLGQERQPALTGPGNAPNGAGRDETPPAARLRPRRRRRLGAKGSSKKFDLGAPDWTEATIMLVDVVGGKWFGWRGRLAQPVTAGTWRCGFWVWTRTFGLASWQATRRRRCRIPRLPGLPRAERRPGLILAHTAQIRRRQAAIAFQKP